MAGARAHPDPDRSRGQTRHVFGYDAKAIAQAVCLRGQSCLIALLLLRTVLDDMGL